LFATRCFALLFGRIGVIHRHAPEAQKGHRKTNMTNETANTAATVAEQGAHVAPEAPSSKKGATPKKGAPKGQKTAKGAKTKTDRKKAVARKKPVVTEGRQPRAESKGAKILELIGRPKGATLAEIQKATDWQAHSVRGFLSNAAKKQGLNIESTKTEAGERVYKISR
jgi:hypothetical protein